MTRVKKIDNAFKKRFERVEKKRSVNTRNKLVYFLIVCEGKRTEPEYFEALAKELTPNTVELNIEGTGRNTIGLVEYTIKLRDESLRKYDRVWAVFDKDSFPAKNFNSAIIKADSNNINCAWTNEAFELWFLLHFQFVNHSMNRDDYKAFLEREVIRVSGNKKYKYKKNDINTYALINKYGSQQQAIDWANKLQEKFTDTKFATHNPCTRVHILIEELFNPEEALKNIKA